MNTTRHLAVALLLPLLAIPANAVVRPVEVVGAPLPPIWVEAGPRERLKATQAAELDADRLLIERIYGIQLDANTSMRDLALESDRVDGAISASLVGAMTVGEPEYFPDGRVEVVRSVKLREVVETLNRVVKGKKFDDGSVSATSDVVKTDRETRERSIDVLGNAALPGSEGQQKIMAKRAAELDAYRKLAQRMMSISIDGSTTIRDFALENDEVVSRLAQVLKGAKPTGIRFNTADGSCEVDMEVVLADVVRTTQRSEQGRTTKTLIKDETNERTFSATGRGAMRDVLAINDTVSLPEADAPRGGDMFFETEMILREVIESRPVVQ